MTIRVWLAVLGGLFLLGGAATLLHPFPASLTIELIAGWAFLVLGILKLLSALRHPTAEARPWLALLGLTLAILGFVLLRDPFAGLVALTVLVAMSFLISGLFKLAIGRQLEQARLGWGVMASGAFSILFGVMVLTNIPASANVLLGALLGLELVSTGLTALFLAAALP